MAKYATECALSFDLQYLITCSIICNDHPCTDGHFNHRYNQNTKKFKLIRNFLYIITCHSLVYKQIKISDFNLISSSFYCAHVFSIDHINEDVFDRLMKQSVDIYMYFVDMLI